VLRGGTAKMVYVIGPEDNVIGLIELRATVSLIHIAFRAQFA
jgi:hypothetical protein